MHVCLQSLFQADHIKFRGDFPSLVRQSFRSLRDAPSSAPSQEERVLRFGVGKPGPRAHRSVHRERMLEMPLRLVELAERRRQHAE